MTDLAHVPQSPGWFPPPHGLTEIQAVYGKIAVAAGDVAPRAWEAAHMVVVHDLPLWADRPLYVNRLIEPMLREALDLCAALTDGYQLLELGCFAPRPKRSNGELSTHSWGIAVDVNASSNPPIRIRGPADLARRTKSIPDAWVDAFKSVGWTWGGDFSSYYDPMHFQWASGY